MKNFFKDFVAFIKRGNVLDLAVGIIIGGAFNTVVRSLVNDVLMPIVGVIFKTDVTDMKWILVQAVYEGETIVKNAVELRYGMFIQTIIDFLIIAMTIFVIIKVVKRMQMRREQILERLHRKEEETEAKNVVETKSVKPKPTTEEILLDIKNLLQDLSHKDAKHEDV